MGICPSFPAIPTASCFKGISVGTVFRAFFHARTGLERRSTRFRPVGSANSRTGESAVVRSGSFCWCPPSDAMTPFVPCG